MAPRFSKVQVRILLALTDKYQRSSDIGIGPGEVYRLLQMNLVQKLTLVSCRNCGKRRGVTIGSCGCENPVWPTAEDAFLRLTPLGAEQQKSLRRAKSRDDRMLFLGEEGAVAKAEGMISMLPGVSVVAFQLKEPDDRWAVENGTKAPRDARAGTEMLFSSKPLQVETTMSDEEKSERFARSKRGEWLISRALCALEKQLDAVLEVESREQSDLDDVRELLKVYPAYQQLQNAIAEAVKPSDGDDESWLNL